MTRSIFLFAAFLSIVSFCQSAEPRAEKQNEVKPNIILIMADDLGYADLSCYGSKLIQTPALDQLAATGVRCTDFHSNGAVCSPTRAALMTGRYQQRSGVTGVITAKSHRDKGLALNEWTIAEALKKQGYQTALFGKWHLGYDPKFNPTKQGFHEFKGFVSGNIDYHNHIDQEGYFDWWIKDERKDEPGYLTDLVNNSGIDFIKRHKTKPFFLMLSHGAPHYPLQGRETPAHRVTGKPYSKQPKPKLNKPRETYKEMVEVMDEGIGKLVAELDKLQLRENTLIIFCSDNGPTTSVSAQPFRGKKGTLWEGGHRVCAIFNWQGKLKPKTTCPYLILTMDLFPTFLSLAGAKALENHTFDGQNIFPALQKNPIARQPVFWRFRNVTAVRSGDWKLILTNGKKRLFNLAKDPSEKSDISSEHPDRTSQLSDLIKKWRAEVTP